MLKQTINIVRENMCGGKMNINQVNTVSSINTAKSPKEIKEKNTQQVENLTQIKSDTSNAAMAYGLSQVNFGGVQKVQPVQDGSGQDGVKTLNLFYFSDTHGELTGLTKLGAAKSAAEQICGGKDNLTVLGSGDLISGSQMPVIQATVSVVNQLGMEANALGNHERSRSDEQLAKLNQDMTPEMLAINASENDRACSVLPSKICKQGDIEFIAVGAQPLSEVDSPVEIARDIDAEVARIKGERRSQGLNDNLPVVFLSHMGTYADAVVAQKSESVNLILGGHTHNVEEKNFVNKSGQNVLVLQGGKNNEYATVVKMDISPDGAVVSTAKKIDIKADEESICKQVQEFYDTKEDENKLLQTVKQSEEKIAETVAEQVGPKKDLAVVGEGLGYESLPEANGEIRERNYSNPVANMMADAMLAATKSNGVQVAFFKAPTVKDTAIPDGVLSNYDVMGRMIPFGGEVVTAEISVDKLYEIIEREAQGVATGGSQLAQVGGMVYSVDADKAQARNNARIGILQAEKDLKKAIASGIGTEDAQNALKEAKDKYSSLPGCVTKIMLLQDDGSELKINEKAIKRGDYEGITLKCAMDDFMSKVASLDADKTGIELVPLFEQQIKQIQEENDGQFFVDQNDVRISIKDKNGIINGYEPQTGVNTKYWY